MIKEKFASDTSLIHQLDPKVRVICAIMLSCAAALCDNLYIAVWYFVFSFVLAAIARLNWQDVLNRLKPVFWFLLMLWIIVPVTFDGRPVFQYHWLQVTSPGLILCSKITIKSITILLLFTALIATMTVASLGTALHRLYVPDKMVFLLLMSYRYVAVIEQEYKRLLRAAKFRGFVPRTNLHAYKTFAYLAGMLFVRASMRAGRVHQAMLCRGFHQKFYSLDVFKPTRLNSVFLLIISAAGITLVLLEIIWM